MTFNIWPSNRLKILFFLFALTPCIVLAQFARLREDVYMTDETSMNIALMHLSPKKIKYKNEVNKVRTIPAGEVLMVFNKVGEYIVYPNKTVKKGFSNQFIQANTLPMSDMILTLENKIIFSNIISKSENEIIYDNLEIHRADEQSIAKDSLAAIIYRNGTHELLVSPSQAAKILASQATSIRNYRLSGSMIREAIKPVAKAVPSVPSAPDHPTAAPPVDVPQVASSEVAGTNEKGIAAYENKPGIKTSSNVAANANPPKIEKPENNKSASPVVATASASLPEPAATASSPINKTPLPANEIIVDQKELIKNFEIKKPEPTISQVLVLPKSSEPAKPAETKIKKTEPTTSQMVVLQKTSKPANPAETEIKKPEPTNSQVVVLSKTSEQAKPAETEIIKTEPATSQVMVLPKTSESGKPASSIPQEITQEVSSNNITKVNAPTLTATAAGTRKTVNETVTNVAAEFPNIDIELFTNKALFLKQSLDAYIAIILNKNSNEQQSNEAIDQACTLFVSEDARVEVSNNRGADYKVRFRIRDFLHHLKLFKYETVSIAWTNINYVNNLGKGPDGSTYGLITLQQKLNGFIDGNVVNTLSTRKNTSVIMKPSIIDGDGKSPEPWDVLLSDIGMIVVKKN